MPADFDLAIVGSGFGGSLLAMVARRLGLSVALIERGSHPRFAIGESTSPLMNLLIEQLAHRYDLPRLLPLTTYGAWRRTYPEIGCGLKRGFTYFHQTAGETYRLAPDLSNQLMVAASPNDEVADTHWLRSDVDAFLVREAIALGVDYKEQTTLHTVTFEGRAAQLTGVQKGAHRERPVRLNARLLVDATGPNGFLARALDLPTSPFRNYPATQTLYSHFTGVRRCDEMADYSSHDQNLPYPMDDAALHHVFDGGWMWVLRFGNGVTSAGVALEEWLATELNLSEGKSEAKLEGKLTGKLKGKSEGEQAWHRFLARFPSISAQFVDAHAIRPFTYAPRLAHRTDVVTTGEGWLLLPSAAAFVDPLFSTGMPLTLLGIERLGRILAEAWNSEDMPARLREYGDITLAEADATAHFIGTCYAGMRDFALFREFSMFYFAAASYSEMARRLERPHLVRRFLASDRCDFAPALAQCAHTLRTRATNPAFSSPEDFACQVATSIAPLNIAGLSNPQKQHRYGVDLNDVILNAHKLEMTPEQVRTVIAAASWAGN